AEPTAAVAARVAEARARQARRLAGTGWSVNGDVPGPALRRRFPPRAGSLEAIERSLAAGDLSARGADRVLRVAWTLADLAGRDRPGPHEVLEALGLRTGAAA
ncbi:MAG TPA: ATP-binding protein, partial [Jiangellales bacterium]|nr:ATP-binding protein [Jiangellales bacterium]